MRINTNVPALISYNALNATNKALQKSIERLSTGLRINSAADDAAGLAISEKMRAQYRGLDQAVANSQDGISMIQTAEGALSETHSILQRMRELSVQAANDTLTQEDRGYIQLEIDQLKEEITRISTTTQFNKKQLLDGTAAALWSSDRLTTKAIVNGGLRAKDQFGQNIVNEGNFRITISATPGRAEVLKTDIFKVKHSAGLDINNVSGGVLSAAVGSIATTNTALYDIDLFWDKNGKFMLEDAKTLTITQGNGKTAQLTLYSTDTVGDLIRKLNTAIRDRATGLGQEEYYTAAAGAGATDADRSMFAQFVTAEATPTAAGSSGSPNFFTTAGTIVIQTAVSGAEGRLSFSGDEDILKALSLNVLQEARENRFNVQVQDAHTGEHVASSSSAGVDITGNVLYGVVNPNVDVKFDSMADIVVSAVSVSTPAAAGVAIHSAFVFGNNTVGGDYVTFLHLADNTTVFQIGANQGEDMGINIGNMSAEALGVNKVLVTDRESAARSITIIDNAINKVSTQRAKLGAYQNRLEHTINNLTTASTNMKSAESRIRDADMAKEMMEFTRLNVLSQAGNAMLAQANQLPGNVLTLIR